MVWPLVASIAARALPMLAGEAAGAAGGAAARTAVNGAASRVGSFASGATQNGVGRALGGVVGASEQPPQSGDQKSIWV